LAQQLAAVGINVLTLDYRGFGESGGEPFDKLPPRSKWRRFKLKSGRFGGWSRVSGSHGRFKSAKTYSKMHRDASCY
jgi:alpha-beta hydrolase superfamily lysophospholipase